MLYSKRCHDPTTFWDRRQSRCMFCPFKPGHYVTPNCGKDDDGGIHDFASRDCDNNTFNTGSRAYCQPCTLCPPGYDQLSPCDSTTDTLCRKAERAHTESMTVATDAPDKVPAALTWAVPLILISITLVVLSACVIYIKRKRGHETVLAYNRRTSYTSLSAPPANNHPQDILSPTVLCAPLQTVLDNLDVLEELVILLDPESHGVKNTKHLASHCSFPATWITYTYSMRDSKSPLKAVLEGVNSRHPDWTVGHLVKLLRQIDRNDAIACLGKLRMKELDV